MNVFGGPAEGPDEVGNGLRQCLRVSFGVGNLASAMSGISYKIATDA